MSWKNLRRASQPVQVREDEVLFYDVCGCTLSRTGLVYEHALRGNRGAHFGSLLKLDIIHVERGEPMMGIMMSRGREVDDGVNVLVV